MSDFDDGFVEELKVQSWALYSVGIFIICLRMYARYKRLGGIRNYQLDDYLMIWAAILYTTLIVCLNMISQGGGSNLYPPEMADTFTPEEIQQRILGSKIVVVSEQAMLNVIYTIKACVLIMYSGLTLGLKVTKWVRILAIYVALGWVGTELAFFLTCRPFQGYWSMPPINSQCTTLEYYAITQGCFNISSDICMLFIPLPLILKMHVPWRQKIVLVLIFSLGLFVIMAAILTKVFNLTDIWDPTYMLWYVREASVAIYVSNLPLIWSLLRDWFPWLRALTPGGNTSSRSRGKGMGTSKGRNAGTLTGSRGAPPVPAAGAMPGKARDILAAGRDRIMRNFSQWSLYSLGDQMYEMDIEMGNKDSDGGSSGRDAHRSVDGDSSTSIVGKHEEKSEDVSQGIKVERTVVVEAATSPRVQIGLAADGQPVYDWMHTGEAKHSARATGGCPGLG